MALTTQTNSDDQAPTLFASGRSASPLSVVISVVCALLFVLGLFYFYLYLRNKHAAKLAPLAQTNEKPKPAPSPQAQIALDQAWAKDGQAFIGGTVRNISSATLNNLAVEIELRKRADGQLENRDVNVQPTALEPNTEGRFSLKVPAHDYVGLRLLRLHNETNAADIAFKSVPGAPRPLEGAPQTKTIIVEGPAPRRHSSEEFLNTPDNPETIH
jgi:hypothetical protein